MAHLKIRVSPGARSDGIAGWLEDILRVRVKAPPERGKANRAAIAVIASTLAIPASQVTLERGATSRDKVLRIEGLTGQQVMERLPEKADSPKLL